MGPDSATTTTTHDERTHPRDAPDPADGAVRPRAQLPGIAGRTVHLLDRAMAPFWNHPLLFSILILATIASAIWGFVSFYGPQYGRTPAYTWLFVPDSPLSITAWLLAAIALKAGWTHKEGTRTAWALLTNWAAMMNAKVGVWTAFAILYYADRFLVGTTLDKAFQWMLVFSHLGMVVFSVFLIRKHRLLPIWGYAVVLSLGLTWDFMDYFYADLFLDGSVRIYPDGIPADPERMPLFRTVTILMTITATLFVAVMTWLRGPPVDR